jgi:hypothetical protein
MNQALHIGKAAALVALAVVAVSSAAALAQEKAEDSVTRQFWADAKVLSFRPGEELATYRGQPNGGIGPGGTLTLGIGMAQRHFEVKMVARLKGQRFLINVTVTPEEEDKQTRAQTIDYDLTDLNQRSLEIARDDDGRIYRLSLVPSIMERAKPRQFKTEELRLENWTFPSSPVIVNDQDYVGRLSFGSSPVGWCDIPGLAKIEFSLFHLKDALPIGTLEKGVINIVHESGATVRISEVKNGANQEVLEGGPYRVWVRWSKPSQTMEEYREDMKKYLASLREQVRKGESAIAPGTLERLEKSSEAGRIVLLGGGVRGFDDGELVRQGADQK